MAEVEIPPYFLCPITLEIMKDPVTVATGITYERDSIEKWIFSEKNTTCPVTKQNLSDTADFTPNIILRRLIQSWCTLNPEKGVERLPTPKAPVTKHQLVKILNEGKNPQRQIECLRRLGAIASHSHCNKRSMEAAGAADFLASFIARKAIQTQVFDDLSDRKTCEEALAILCSLRLSESSLKSLVNVEFLYALTLIMQWGSCESRVYAIMLLKSMVIVADLSTLIYLKPQFFTELARSLSDQISERASRAALKVLSSACPLGRNRIKAVEAGVIPILINLLLDCADKRACEMALIVMDLLCQCADGRAELLDHSAGLAIVSKKIMRVSHVATEKAVRIIHSISMYSATPAVLLEMLQIGVVAKLCLVLQVDCGSKTKEKAKEILMLHTRAWRNSSCIPKSLISSYPSSTGEEDQ